MCSVEAACTTEYSADLIVPMHSSAITCMQESACTVL